MDFEPIDSDLEDLLERIIEETGDAPGVKFEWSSDVEELMRLGLLDAEKSHPYKSGDGLVFLTRRGKTYPANKQEWEILHKSSKKGGVLQGIAKAAGTFTGAAVKEINDL